MTHVSNEGVYLNELLYILSHVLIFFGQ